MNQSSKYIAYISYSHKDAKWAEWLHRHIETYKIPGHLVDSLGLPQRLSPVFRDRVELPSSRDLGKAIDTALRDSDALIVLCSPDSAKSSWVNEEIRRFRSMGKGNRIFSLIVGYASPTDITSSFPPALTEEGLDISTAEPNAADAITDGKKNALLKLIAGLLSVGLDDLIQRDLQRRLRLMAVGMTLSIVLAVVLAALSGATYLAKQESEQRRHQVEDLVGFMLTDLRKRLEPIGRIDVLDVVADKAMAYFATQDARQETVQTLIIRALALRQIGEVRMLQGAHDKALATFSDSLTISEQLVSREPDDTERLFDLGQVQFWIGYAHWEKLQYDAAESAFHNYLETAQKLIALNDIEPRWLMEAAYANQNLGSLYLRQRKYNQALNSFEEAAKVFEVLVKMNPADLEYEGELANVYSWLGSTLYELGDLGQSISHYLKDVEIYRTIITSSNDKNFEARFAEQLLLLSKAYLVTDDIDSSEKLVREAATLYESLVQRDSRNMRWLRNSAITHLFAGKVNMARGNWQDAMTELRLAESEIESVLTQASSINYQIDAAKIANSIAELNLWSGNIKGAKKPANDALVWLSSMESQSPDIAIELVRSYLVIAKIGGDDESSKQHLLKADQLISELEFTKNPDVVALSAEVAHQVGDTTKAIEALNRLESVGYRTTRTRVLQEQSVNPK